MPSLLSSAQLARFNADGFIIVRGMFGADETALLRSAMEQDPEVSSHIIDRLDAQGAATRIALWNRAGDSVYGMAARCARMVDTMEALLGGPVYHFQSKLTAKEPFVGGAWEWHQDYGYWYHNGCLQPLMASAFIAVDRATRENGCVQVLRGSHQLGRIDHVLTGEQAGADMERVKEVLQREQLVYVEMEPGDTLFFHCNTLHRSDQNRSQHPRWSMICSYNAARNDPYKESQHPRYTPLVKVPDSRIREYGERRFSGSEDKEVWLSEQRDTTASKLRR